MSLDFLKKLPAPLKLVSNMNQITLFSRRDSKKLKKNLKKVKALVEKVVWTVSLLRLWWNLQQTQEQLNGWKTLVSWLNSRCWNKIPRCSQSLCNKTLVWARHSTCLLVTLLILPRELEVSPIKLKQKAINQVLRWKRKLKKKRKSLCLLHKLLRKKNLLKKQLQILMYLNMRELKMKAMKNTRRRISRKHLNFTIRLLNLNLLKCFITTIKQLFTLNSSS